MRNKSPSYFALAQILITLAGFMFVIATFLWGLEKEFAFQGITELRQNYFAKENNQSQINVNWTGCFEGICMKSGSYWDWSLNYNIWKMRILEIGITLSILSILFWFIGHEKLCKS